MSINYYAIRKDCLDILDQSYKQDVIQFVNVASVHICRRSGNRISFQAVAKDVYSMQDLLGMPRENWRDMSIYEIDYRDVLDTFDDHDAIATVKDWINVLSNDKIAIIDEYDRFVDKDEFLEMVDELIKTPASTTPVQHTPSPDPRINQIDQKIIAENIIDEATGVTFSPRRFT